MNIDKLVEVVKTTLAANNKADEVTEKAEKKLEDAREKNKKTWAEYDDASEALLQVIGVTDKFRILSCREFTDNIHIENFEHDVFFDRWIYVPTGCTLDIHENDDVGYRDKISQSQHQQLLKGEIPPDIPRRIYHTGWNGYPDVMYKRIKAEANRLINLK